MFFRPDGKDGGENVKKTQQLMPEKLKELKLLLKDNDIKNKDVLLSKTDQIEKQMDVLSEIRKYGYFQIPMYDNKQQEKTAELYVYQYRKRKAERDRDHTLVVVSLDTENIGRVETVINASGKHVSLKFRVQSNGVRTAVSENKTELTKRVEAAGYQVSEFETALLGEKTDVTNAIDMLMLEAGVTDEGVDIRI